MTSESRTGQKSDPVTRIFAWACSVGAASFAAGFFGPLLLSKSNLGPLLGIFITGPLGTLAGALVGALRVTKDSVRYAIACIGSVWVMTLLYTLFLIGLAAQITAIPLQFLVIASSIFLFLRRDTRLQLPDGLRRSGLIAIAAEVIVLFMTLFPPVTRPWWVPAGQQPVTPAPLPPFAFILDGRFYASQHFPQFAVSREALAWEWILTAAVAIGLGLLMRALGPRSVV